MGRRSRLCPPGKAALPTSGCRICRAQAGTPGRSQRQTRGAFGEVGRRTGSGSHLLPIAIRCARDGTADRELIHRRRCTSLSDGSSLRRLTELGGATPGHRDGVPTGGESCFTGRHRKTFTRGGLADNLGLRTQIVSMDVRWAGPPNILSGPGLKSRHSGRRMARSDFYQKFGGTKGLASCPAKPGCPA